MQVLHANIPTGIRPLVRDPNAKNTESLVRNHLVTVSDSGLLTCAGGKWSGLGAVFNDAAILDGSCQTHRVRLIGAHGYSKTLFINLIQHFGIAADVAKHLSSSYGDRAWDVAALACPANKATNYPFRGRKLSPIYPFIDGEVRYAVRSEYAQTAVDVLARRTRLSFLNVQAALEALPMVIDLMGEELHWNQTRKDLEWTETVHFLASMGLPESKLNITREQVLGGETTMLIEEPQSKRSESSTANQRFKLMATGSPAVPSMGAPEVRPENVGLEPNSPTNIYP
jgi:glycerol-3-phosphate dehydrogenase